MKCKHCKSELIIDEWNGWVWTCFFCEYVGRKATEKEIEKHEKNMDKIYNAEQR